MTNDIVQRLRMTAAEFGDCTEKEAADLIEALEAEVERLKLHATNDDAECKRMMQHCMALEDALKAKGSRAEAAEAEVALLRDAIKLHVDGCEACGGAGVLNVQTSDPETECDVVGCVECSALRSLLEAKHD